MLVLGVPERVLALEDLNREFVEAFFRPGADEPDRLRPAGSGATPDPGFTPAERPGSTEGSIDGVSDPSWVGKFLQLAIIALLGFIVYLLSRKSRTRGRGRHY